MKTDEIRELVAKARIEAAVRGILELTADTELEDLGTQLSRSYRSFKKSTISGILSVAEERQELALITNRLLNLLNEFEILQLKDLKSDLDLLKRELQSHPEVNEVNEVAREINDIGQEIKDIDVIESKEEIEPGAIEKIGNFLARLKDPNSKEGKVIQVIHNGIKITQSLASKYNYVAEWFGLPQVPRLFLGEHK